MKRKGFEGYEFMGTYSEPTLDEDINLYYKREGDVHKFKFREKLFDEIKIIDNPVSEASEILGIICK